MMATEVEKYDFGYDADGSELTVRERTVLFNQNMDSLPVPFGDWATEYSKQQTKYHIHMVISAVLFTAAMYYFCTQGYVVMPDLKKPLNLEEVYQARLERSKE